MNSFVQNLELDYKNELLYQLYVDPEHLQIHYGRKYKPFIAKESWNSPSPDYYQTTVAELWHKLNLRRVTNS